MKQNIQGAFIGMVETVTLNGHRDHSGDGVLSITQEMLMPTDSLTGVTMSGTNGL